MDELERDHLRHEIRQLQQSNHRWKPATFALAAALAIFLIVSVMSSFSVVQLARERETAIQRALATEAALQAEQARNQRQQRARQAEEEPDKPAKEQGAKRGAAAGLPDNPEAAKSEVGPQNCDLR